MPNQLEGEVVVGPFSPRPGFPDWLQAVIFYRPAANTAPGVEDIPNQTTTWGTPVGPVSFTVSDAETAAGALTVTATSSNQTVLPDANISLGGSGATRTITLTPVVGQAGTATVTVSVEDGGALSTQDTFTLTVTAAAPVASFTGTPTSGTDPVSVTFTDASTNSPTSWLWERNSGGGWTTFSTSQNPTQAFASGTWSVRLTATNAGGSDTQTRTNYLVIAAAGITELGTATGYGTQAGAALGFAFAGQDTTGANFLSVQLSGWSNWAALPTVTDNKGNTWTRSASIGVGSSYSVIFTCVPISVGANHVVTVAGVNLYGSGVLRWFSGVHQTSTIEATRSTNNTRTDTFTTANDGDLILTCSAAGANSQNYDPGDLTTPASGFSPVKVLSNQTGLNSCFGVATGAGVKETAGSVTTTYTGGDSGGTATVIVKKA